MSDIEIVLADLLAATPFHTELGLRLVSAGEGSCVIETPLLARTQRPGGIMAGYVLVAAADVAAWLAIKTLLGADDASVTSDLHTAFVRPAPGSIHCTATVVRCGRRLITVGADCTDESGRTVARHTVTYARIES